MSLIYKLKSLEIINIAERVQLVNSRWLLVE